MRVGANVQDNQLLLWVNEIELEEVRNLLEKLGEIPPKEGRPSTLRVIDASRQPETYEYLKRLKEQWDRVSPNPLQIPDESEFLSEEDKAARAEAEKKSEEKAEQDATEDSDADSDSSPAGDPKRAVPATDESSITRIRSRPRGEFIQLTGVPVEPQDETSKSNSRSEPVTKDGPDGSPKSEYSDPESRMQQAQADAENAPPVRIYLDSGGNIVIESEDTKALDRLEQIMQSNKPPQRPYDIFKVKYARASWVTLNLEEYFEKNEDSRPRYFSFYWDDANNDEKESQLGDKPPLRFIWDNDTNSIVVQGADDLDRQTIKELIELWDVPEEVDTSLVRYTKLIKVRYSRAELIVNTIKEAYRDMLSATDKTFQGGEEGGGDDESKRGGGGSGVGGGGLTMTGLKGKLSLGPDALTNSILLSVEGEELMKVIEGVIEELDEAAKDQGAVEVYKVAGNVNGNSLKKALSAILGQTSTPKQQPQQNNQNQPNENQAAEQQAQMEAARSERSRRGRSRR